MALKKIPCEVDLQERSDVLIVAKSGLMVNVLDDFWTILPNKGKGSVVDVSWVRAGNMSVQESDLVVDVLSYYVRAKAASTASGLASNVKTVLGRGIPSLMHLKALWSGLKTNNKKGLNQFFGTLAKQGNSEFERYHEYTSQNLDKFRSNALDASKGALSSIEFDSLAKQINAGLQEFDWGGHRDFSFFRSFHYCHLRNIVTNKLLLSTVRRPIQISVMKWSDLIPSGGSFNDTAIKSEDELLAVGGRTLQLRVFVAKAKGSMFIRDCPERYPLYISEHLSVILSDYKKIVFEGLSFLLESAGISVEDSVLLELMGNVPMFPDSTLFELQLNSLEFFKALFTPTSTAFHTSEAVITSAMRRVRVVSDRSVDCKGTSNRIRHTVLTRGALDGLSAAQLAKITGVTVPAARYYIDLNYCSRREIDEKYIGNKFLKEVFCKPIAVAPEGEELILDSKFDPVGGARNRRTCNSCATVLGRPLGCYGCPNFRPIVEADHRSVLIEAEEKLAVNRSSLVNPLFARSIEKLERQISWVKLTISVCDEYLHEVRAVHAK